MLIQGGPQGEERSEIITKFAAYAHERIARLRAMRGRNLEAAQHVQDYRKLDPGNRFGRLDRVLLTEALIAWIERRFRDSIRKLEEGLATYPGSPERDQTLLALGVVLHESGSDPRALQVLGRLLREYPLSPSAAQATEQIAHIKNPPPEHTH